MKCLQREVDYYKKVRANRNFWVNFCPHCHCIAAHFSSLQSVLFLQLLQVKVILAGCHWRAVLPSHKSIRLHVTVPWTYLKEMRFAILGGNEILIFFISLYDFSLDHWSHRLLNALLPSFISSLLCTRWQNWRGKDIQSNPHRACDWGLSLSMFATLFIQAAGTMTLRSR